jgi:hypothetical protein
VVNSPSSRVVAAALSRTRTRPAASVAERAVPQAGDLGDGHGVGAPVAGHAGRPPGRGRAGLGGVADPVAPGAGTSALAGGWWGRPVQHRVTLHPGGEGDAIRQIRRGCPVGERPRQQPDQRAGQLDRGRAAVAAPQPKQHRQTPRPRLERQPHHQTDDDPAIAAGGHPPGLGGVVGPECGVDLLGPAGETVCRRPRPRAPPRRAATAPRPAGPAPVRARRPTTG